MEVIFTNTDKILVVAPHQDDETIGCGGLLAKYGKQCDVLLLTDGSKGITEEYNDQKKIVDIRNKELNKAMKIAKVKNIYSLNLENEKLKDHIDEIKTFDIRSYDYIFVPNRKETHVDHKILPYVFMKMKKNQKSKAQIYEYEVWTTLESPTWHLDISDVIDTKIKMLQAYKSQLTDRDYLNATIGLNMYRGLDKKYEYAEAFTSTDYYGIKKTIYEMLPDSLKKFIVKHLYK